MIDRIVDEAHAGQLPVLIDEWAGETDERRWLSRSLRLDLALLVARPELTVPCLLRRCWWFGEEYPSFSRTVIPEGADAVRALARSWRTTGYLRSLRSPSVPLDGGAIEEYRTSVEGAVWLTASHVGAGTVAWERASGRRAVVPRPEPAAPRWTHDRNLARLVSADRAWPLPYPPDETPYMVGVVADLAIINCSYWDNGDDLVRVTHAFDLADGTERFQLSRNTTAVAHFADRLYFADGDDLLVTTPDGDTLSRHHIVGTGLVFGPDGTFATRDGHVIRIWDPTQLSLHQISDIYQSGLVALSPDSTRAITGRAVTDAHTGEELFRVDFNGLGGWLEGGPPRNCRALCDGVLIEIQPFGYHLWDSTTGEVLVDERDHRAGIHDATVAFAPNGRVHAIMRRGTVTVFDNRTLAVLHESRVTVTKNWNAMLAFSRDGSTLWWGDGESPPTSILMSGTVRQDPVKISNAQVDDGIVTLASLALPIDDTTAVVANDGQIVLGWSTYLARD